MTVSGHVPQHLANDIPVIDYEGSRYKTDFWEGRGRDYEDATERLVLQRLLPAQGPRIAEIGAGFGRLANLYLGYEQIILFDYSRTLLQDAVQRWGHDPRFVFVAGNVYELPFATGCLDSLVMVRVMHHLAHVPQALRQIERVLHRHSIGVVEYANKRNLKALSRWILGRQGWSPLDLDPVEFVKLNFDFHPQWMNQQLAATPLRIRKQLAVSHLRMPWLKERFNAATLAKVDSWLFELGGYFPVSPSVFVQVETVTGRPRNAVSDDPADVAKLFHCPQCNAEAFELVSSRQLLCKECATTYQQKEGIWDFKGTVSTDSQ
jgi:SAM-dependent methyltransferase